MARPVRFELTTSGFEVSKSCGKGHFRVGWQRGGTFRHVLGLIAEEEVRVSSAVPVDEVWLTDGKRGGVLAKVR